LALTVHNGEIRQSDEKCCRTTSGGKNPRKDGFPPIGTVCAIRKHGETMIGRLVDTEEWDDWEVNGEYEDCVEEYFILPKKQSDKIDKSEIEYILIPREPRKPPNQ
jgi:hypothetical protein